MIIDIIFLLIIVFAVFKGMSQGLIVALFSFVSFIIGLAAAIKLSATVANYLHTKMNVDGYWLPILSFIIVFAGVVLIVRWAAAIIKKAVSIAFLGWLDALGGIVLYALMYLMIFSVLLFYASQIHFIPDETKASSKTYTYIQPWGPKVLNWLGTVIPFFKGMFADLQNFFQNVTDKAK
jgi:membrane protein required for colicin V production